MPSAFGGEISLMTKLAEAENEGIPEIISNETRTTKLPRH
jgi:hypothetical protein